MPITYFIAKCIINLVLPAEAIKLSMAKNKKAQPSDESDHEQENNKSQKSQNSNEEPVDTDNSPKNIPVAKLPERLRTKKIVINISDTQYPIVEEVAEELGWVVERAEGQGDWDVWWTDREITPDTLYKMNLHQKINHFPGIYVLARKNMLGLNLMSMRDKFKEEYDFFPETWVIPLQFAKFRAYYQATEKGKAKTYIVKPEALSQGRGIFLTRSIEQIMTGRKYVVQRYIRNPLLIDDLKFDLRIYVLLAGTDPLRLYLYEQGLTRFATRKYEEPTDQNLQSAFIHLTNYSLNKKNPEYVYNTSAEDMTTGHKRSLSSTYEHLAKKGYDVAALKQNIEQVIVKTFISGLPAISHQYQYCQPEEYENNMCFHILGVDIMVTADMKPYLIEINHTPSFETGTPLDYKVKKSLIADTLKLMRITAKNKRLLFEKSKQIIKRRVETGRREILRGEARQQLVQEAQAKRDKEEAALMGGFKKIFPLADEQKMQSFRKMIAHAEQVHKQTDEARQKFIREEQQRLKVKKREDANVSESKEAKNVKNAGNSHGNTQSVRKKHIRLEQMRQKHLIQLSSEKDETRQRRSATKSSPKLPKLEAETPRKAETPASHMDLSANIAERPRNCSFRTKTKKYTYCPKQQFVRFSEFMLNYISAQNQKKPESVPSSIDIDQEAFNAVKQRADRRKKDAVLPQQREKPKEGAYIVPRTYQIADSKQAMRIESDLLKRVAHQKQIANGLEPQKVKQTLIKGPYQRKRYSVN